MAIKEKQTELIMVIHTEGGMSNYYTFKTFELAQKYANQLAKELHAASEDYTDVSELTRGLASIDLVSNTLYEYFEVADEEVANG